MLIQPRNNHVLIRVKKGRKEGYQEAEILAVGPGNWSTDGTRREAPDLKVGARALVGDTYESNRVQRLKGDCYLITEFNVVAVMLEGD